MNAVIRSKAEDESFLNIYTEKEDKLNSA